MLASHRSFPQMDFEMANPIFNDYSYSSLDSNGNATNDFSLLMEDAPSTESAGENSSINPNQLHGTDVPRTTPDPRQIILNERGERPRVLRKAVSLSLRPLSLGVQPHFTTTPDLSPMISDSQYAFAFPTFDDTALAPSPFATAAPPSQASSIAESSPRGSAPSVASSPTRQHASLELGSTSANKHRPQRSLSTSELSALYTRQSNKRERTESPDDIYLDGSKPPSTSDLSPVPIKSGNLNAGAFVYKLYNMLVDPEHQHLISFSSSGTSFVVSNSAAFSKNVLPKHFKHGNFSSFVRQCNMYGFHKVNKTPRTQRGSTENQICEFSHPKFIRGRTDLLDLIKRKAVEDGDVQNTPAMPSPPLHGMNHYENLGMNGFLTPQPTSRPSFIQIDPYTPDSSPVREPARKTSSNSLNVTQLSTNSAEEQLAHLNSQHAELNRYATNLEHTCARLQRDLHDCIRKQDMLVDLVGNMFNSLQTGAGGQLGFGFPADLAEPMLPTLMQTRTRPVPPRTHSSPHLTRPKVPHYLVSSAQPSPNPSFHHNVINTPSQQLRIDDPRHLNPSSPYIPTSVNNYPTVQSAPAHVTQHTQQNPALLHGLGVQYQSRYGQFEVNPNSSAA